MRDRSMQTKTKFVVAIFLITTALILSACISFPNEDTREGTPTKTIQNSGSPTDTREVETIPSTVDRTDSIHVQNNDSIRHTVSVYIRNLTSSSHVLSKKLAIEPKDQRTLQDIGFQNNTYMIKSKLNEQGNITHEWDVIPCKEGLDTDVAVRINNDTITILQNQCDATVVDEFSAE